MNLKTTLILLLFLGLAVVGLLLTMDRDPNAAATPSSDGETAARSDQPILSADDLGTALTSITFDAGPTQSLRIERLNGRWRITEPHRFPTQLAVIDEVLTVLGNLSGVVTEETTDAPSDAHAIVLGYDDRQIMLHLGSRTGAGRASISVVRTDTKGAKSYNTQDTLFDIFESFDPRVFYSNKPDPPAMPNSARIVWRLDDEASSMVQADGDWWIEHTDGKERVLQQDLEGYTSIDEYFRLLRSLEIVEHVESASLTSLAAYGLERPLIEVRIIEADKDTDTPDAGWVLRVGVPADPADQARYVAAGPATDKSLAVFKLATPFALAVGQTATRFRDPRPITTPAPLIASITTRDQANETTKISFNTDGSTQLQRGSAAPIELKQEDTARLLSALQDARATDYLDEKPEDATRLLTLTVEVRLGKEPERVTLFQERGATHQAPTVLVQRGDEPVLLRFDRSAFTPLLAPISFGPDE